MSDIAIHVENLSKQYRIGGPQARYKTIRESLTEAVQAPFRRLSSVVRGQSSTVSNETIWALKDVSFEVKRGEVVGIIGRNGAGKTTLLKILSRITEPTEGYAEIHGRVGSLLEVGTGFHPELTGRENIYLNGAILGMKRTEIERKFDEIVDFSGVEKFMDTPVKHYSSGMYVRLAFAVAAHLEPEILLVDEVLAVGDVQFQKKCLGKMGDVAKEGRTVLFVSHNMAAVENLCQSGILLDAGKVMMQDEIISVIHHYLETILPDVASVPLSSRIDRSGNGRIRLTGFHIEDKHGRRVAALQSGKDAVFVFSYSCARGDVPKNVSVGFGLFSSTGQLLFVLYSSYTGQDFDAIPLFGQFRCQVPRLPLAAGRYRVGARVTVDGEEADWPRDAIGYVDVELGDFFGTGAAGFGGNCPFLVEGSWSVTSQ
jgi:lipopolysaccharide transport system ATP-binding protein